MHCLYCGRLIGPIRLLRDREFCSSAHRDGYRERFRQRVHELLATEPAPVKMAGLVERPVTGSGYFLHDSIPTHPKPALGRRHLVLQTPASRNSDWSFIFTPSVTGLPPLRASSFRMVLHAAGAERTGTVRAHLSLRDTAGSRAGVSVSPLVACIPTLRSTGLAATPPHIAALRRCTPVTSGPAISLAYEPAGAMLSACPERTGTWALAAARTLPEMVGRLAPLPVPVPACTARIASQPAVRDVTESL